jgi:glycosyltransferase involved in cell wall biosynthesis
LNLALLIGNRFTPWHFKGYTQLQPQPDITVFRARSEIQDRFDARNDAEFGFEFEDCLFDVQSPNPLTRIAGTFRTRSGGKEPRLLPFHERLKGFDLIQSWELFTDWSAEAVKARKAYGVPLAVMVWDNIPFNMEQTPERRAIKRSVLDTADLLIVHTERSRRMLCIEGASPDRIAFVPPGVDTDVFSPGPAARAAFGLADDEFVILFVGWFLPRKGIDFLLLALRELLDDPEIAGRRLRLLMVGSGPGQDRVEALIRRLDIGASCTFAGSLPYGRMPEVFRSADAFVLPSIATPEWQEQFGMALLEAMACGTPVVTTTSGAIPEIAGNSAVLCQPNDFASLHAAFKQLIAEPELGQELAKAGRAHAVNHFALPQFAGALRDAYGRIVTLQ